ncbi:c-type cytochrome [Flavobacterium luminosum]|uniref:Cytochrome c n=1 Tax=Flavobacterium luminosum TaxID=2949086 RepID=A0ABT0TLS9_9FLAO|nr:c-type cytochrome [Flavobacterium sp. HXWNR70]MCL9808442.1 cytochrome c [Flavobacterium sp. HXWNR70]
MKRIMKFLGYIFILACVLILGALTYAKTMLPSVGEVPNLKVAMTKENIARGKYLANNVMVCMDCHSSRDWGSFAGPPKEGTLGMGGEIFDQKLGFPGKFVASNITPANLKSWSDGEIFRAITSGVNKDGRALFPVMPHISYGQLDQKDIFAVIAYIRTLKPIEHKTEPSVADFPMNFIINTIPQKAEFSSIPSDKKSVAYGKYLTTAAACYDCHTRQEKGKFVGEPFAGGFEFQLPGGATLRSANITPHPTGIGQWTEKQFIKRFKDYANPNYVAPKVKPGEFQTMMPWNMYAGMTEEDLAAIFKYLKSLEPKNNAVTRFTPST